MLIIVRRWWGETRVCGLTPAPVTFLIQPTSPIHETTSPPGGVRGDAGNGSAAARGALVTDQPAPFGVPFGERLSCGRLEARGEVVGLAGGDEGTTQVVRRGKVS